MQIAESKGLPKLKYHLLPRTKGFYVTVQNLRGTGEYLAAVFFFFCMALSEMAVLQALFECGKSQINVQMSHLV